MVKNKDDINLDTVVEKLNNKKDATFYLLAAEMHYKDIVPRIVCERYLTEEGVTDLTDYKFYCYSGTPKFVMVCTGRAANDTKFYFFDMDWNFLRINKDGFEAESDFMLRKPNNFEKMVEIASALSIDFPFVRTDLYNIDGKIIFGELTFTPASGSDPGLSKELDLALGENLVIS